MSLLTTTDTIKDAMRGVEGRVLIEEGAKDEVEEEIEGITAIIIVVMMSMNLKMVSNPKYRQRLIILCI